MVDADFLSCAEIYVEKTGVFIVTFIYKKITFGKILMSKTNDNHITRQWHIIQYLISLDNYVSSETVFQHLHAQGIAVKDVRTIQRDLNGQAEVFPIECRKVDKPFSWRWRREDNNK